MSQTRSTPVTIKDGRDTPARVVTPAWTRAELEAMALRQAEWGNITREEADRDIAEGRRLLRADGTPRAPRTAHPRKVTPEQLERIREDAGRHADQATERLGPHDPPVIKRQPRTTRTRTR